VKTPAELAADAVAYKGGDYIFDGSMENPTRPGQPAGAAFDTALARFTPFAQGMKTAGYISGKRMTHPIFVKTPKVSDDLQAAHDRIGRQLNAGVSGVVFAETESADEVKAGLAAMRFKSNGGTRSDDVGDAPALWGMSEKEYKEKADLWPLNAKGELVNFTIVETDTGLAHVREIAAVKGIGVLFPGAGTLRQHFTKVDSTGVRHTDEAAWEASIQKVLSACKEFNVPCGYPANDSTMMDMRYKQGFRVFITGWGETGFKAVEVGKKLNGR
jgi:2-keto-3-deoxy-L-rhamnonate aldolase RhmA